MWEVIKNLNPTQKFYAFLVATVLTTVTSFLTSYLATDDCRGLSDQYETLVNNHTRLMKINNELITDNNQKQEDILKIAKLLEDANKCKTPTVYETRKEKTDEFVYNPRYSDVVSETRVDSTVAMSPPPVEEPQPVKKVTKKKRIIKNDVEQQQKKAIDSALQIVNKYKQNK
jgi:hypothetical protein